MEAILESFLSSPDFLEGCKKVTILSWGSGEGYSVELFTNGSWRVLWDGQIGNKYVSSGLILSLPCLNDDDYQECVVEGDMTDEEYFLSVFQNDEEELKNFMHTQMKEIA